MIWKPAHFMICTPQRVLVNGNVPTALFPWDVAESAERTWENRDRYFAGVPMSSCTRILGREAVWVNHLAFESHTSDIFVPEMLKAQLVPDTGPSPNMAKWETGSEISWNNCLVWTLDSLRIFKWGDLVFFARCWQTDTIFLACLEWKTWKICEQYISKYVTYL